MNPVPPDKILEIMGYNIQSTGILHGFGIGSLYAALPVVTCLYLNFYSTSENDRRNIGASGG